MVSEGLIIAVITSVPATIAACAGFLAVVNTRRTAKKVDSVHVLVNSAAEEMRRKLKAALAEVARLETLLRKHHRSIKDRRRTR